MQHPSRRLAPGLALLRDERYSAMALLRADEDYKPDRLLKNKCNRIEQTQTQLKLYSLRKMKSNLTTHNCFMQPFNSYWYSDTNSKLVNMMANCLCIFMLGVCWVTFGLAPFSFITQISCPLGACFFFFNFMPSCYVFFFLVWCFRQDVEFDCIGSRSLPFHLFSIGVLHWSIKHDFHIFCAIWRVCSRWLYNLT